MPNENINEGAPAPTPPTPPPNPTPEAAPPAATPPAETTPPPFDFQKTMLEGLGLAVGNPPEPTPIPDAQLNIVGRTLGETLAVIDEERAAAKAAEGAPPADP